MVVILEKKVIKHKVKLVAATETIMAIPQLIESLGVWSTAKCGLKIEQVVKVIGQSCTATAHGRSLICQEPICHMVP